MAGSIVVAGILLVAGGLAVLWRRRPVVDGRDVRWLAGRTDVPADEAEVYHAYLVRHRRHRTAGGLFGVTIAVVLAVGWYRTAAVGLGWASTPLADPLYLGITGVVVGALLAETYRLSGPREAVATASLVPRETDPMPKHVRAARVLAAGTLLAGVVVAALGLGVTMLAVGAVGQAVALLAERTRLAIDDRPRPALSARALDVDARLRLFAARSVTHLQLALAVLTASWALALAPWPDGEVIVQVLGELVGIAGLVVSVVLLRRAAPRPPKWFERGQGAAAQPARLDGTVV